MPVGSTPSIQRVLSHCAALVFCWTVPINAAASPLPLELSCSVDQVGKYQKVEFSFALPATGANPFDPDEIDLKLVISTPSGTPLELPAFWYQPYERRRVDGRDWMYPAGRPRWAARFAPAQTGQYQAVAVLRTAGATAKSKPVQFRCVPSDSKGFLSVSAKDPRFFELTEGQPFFAIGQNLAFIGNQQYVKLSKAEEIFGKLAANGANYLRVWTCCEDWAMAVEARKSAFGRSWDWRPPLVPVPGQAAAGEKCLKLSEERQTLRVDPSHPVALRPDTRYVFSGKTRLEPGVSLRAELGGKSLVLAQVKADDPGWASFQQEFRTDVGQFWLPPLTLSCEGKGTALVLGLSLQEVGGGPELLWEAELNRPPRGFYNPLDCFMLDELLTAAERNGILLQVCYLTRDLYMNALKEESSPEYDSAIRAAQKALRYAVARWGFSTSVGAWEYWNEMNPGLPTDKFYRALGENLDQVDPYHHLRTTSTWGPSPKDCRHSKLDIADVHFYLRPSDKGRLEDEVHAVLERTDWLRQQAPNKPAHLGEFGLANDKWAPTEEMNRSKEIIDFHNALWASALSGASGTALFWWWDRLDQRNPYGEYKPVSRFVADIPWTSGDVSRAILSCPDTRVRPVGLQTKDHAWIWLFDRQSAWQHRVVFGKTLEPMPETEVGLENLGTGSYQIQWYNTHDGSIVREQRASAEQGAIKLRSPTFTGDIACRVGPTK